MGWRWNGDVGIFTISTRSEYKDYNLILIKKIKNRHGRIRTRSLLKSTQNHAIFHQKWRDYGYFWAQFRNCTGIYYIFKISSFQLSLSLKLLSVKMLYFTFINSNIWLNIRYLVILPQFKTLFLKYSLKSDFFLKTG